MADTLRSFIDVPANSHFPLQNLPYGIFSPPGELARLGVRIGDWVLDLSAVAEAGLFTGPYLSSTDSSTGPFSRSTLNAFMGLGRPAWREARTTLQELLSADNPTLRDDDALRRRTLFPATEVTMHLPASIGDFTDFYSSREHASNVGSMFRDPENPLLPNWLHLPVAYHGRASSIVVSGVDVHRPWGQIKEADAGAPTFRPSREVDFELEVGAFIGPGNRLSEPISVENAEDHVFGLVLVNDWSARDIQRWEYRPLGPFLAKNLATSISPWVVTMEALAPFRVSGPEQDPAPLPYLHAGSPCAYDVHLEASLRSPKMQEPAVITRTNFRRLYWSICQQVAHHTVTGCNLRPGDLLASGTVSGSTPDSYGSLLELSWRGQRPITLPNGETRTFLQDGDRLTLSGWCQGDGYRVGFGQVTARLLPPVDMPQ